MAKKAKKSTKRGTKDLVLALICVVFGILMFSSMFMPLFSAKDIDSKFSTKDVLVAMNVESFADLSELSEGEVDALAVINSEDYGAAVKSTAVTGVICAVLGAVVAVLGLLSMILRLNLLNKLMLLCGILALLAALACLISSIVFLATKYDVPFVGTVKLSDSWGIHAGPIMFLICSLITPVAAFMRKN